MSPDGSHFHSPPQQKKRIWLRTLVLLAVAAGAAYVAFTGIAKRHSTLAQLRETAASRAVPVVAAGPPSVQANVVTLDLPGRLEAYSRAAIFARVSGYLASWNADIGARVKAGELLALIEAPDLDHQLRQAQSDLLNAESAAKLAEVTNERFQALLPNKTISRQTADEKAADLEAKKAQVKSSEANVERLKAMTEFKRLVAPFDGVLTSRNTDVGALINAGSTSGSELFVVSDTSKLRLYINVPQAYAPLVKAGMTARLTVPERPATAYTAKIEAISGAVDIASGTMRTQLGIDNAKGELLPGAYVNAHLELPGGADVLSIPATAVIFDKGGLKVATVDKEGRVTLKAIKIARDLGKVVEVASGLTRDDQVVEAAPDGVVDGDKVVVKAPTPPPTPAAGTQAPVPAVAPPAPGAHPAGQAPAAGGPATPAASK